MCPPPHFGVQYVIKPWMEARATEPTPHAALIPHSQRLAPHESDAIDFACNAVNIDWKIVLNNLSTDATEWLAERGFEVVKTRIHEVMKADGSTKCLSLQRNEE